MKKKTTKKKVSKTKKTVSHEIVVRVQSGGTTKEIPTTTDLAEPMKNGKKLTIPKTWVSSGQLNQILQVTPKQYVYSKPGKGGGRFDYVTASYITKALNYIFGWNWDFDVVEHGIEGGQVWVKGKLTVRGTKDGEVIVKTQFGRNDIKYKRGTRDMLDFGNDMKGAASDALKKCASLLGIASDIYGKGDYKYETDMEPKEPMTPSPASNEPETEIIEKPVLKSGQVIFDGKPAYLCKECDAVVGEKGAKISKTVFGKVLCREHYNEATQNKNKK